MSNEATTTENKKTRAPDPRPARTRAAILAAISRLSEKNIELTVSAVVTEAGLSRSSFYSQFKELGDVAVQLIRDLYTSSENDEKSLSDLPSALAASEHGIHLLATEFAARRALYAAVLGGMTTVGAHREVSEILAGVSLETYGGLVPAGIDPDVAVHFVSEGVLITLARWVQSETPMPQAELERQILALLPDWALSSDVKPAPVRDAR